MVVVPINVCVPDDIYDDILNGSLELYGLVKDGEHKENIYQQLRMRQKQEPKRLLKL